VQKKWSSEGRPSDRHSREVKPYVLSSVEGPRPASGKPGRTGETTAVEEKTQESYRKGYAEGVEAGMARVRRELEEECRAISAMAQGVEQIRKQIYEQMNGEIIDLALHIARKVLQVELNQNPDAMLEMVREAIRAAVDREVLKVSVNLRDFETLNQRRPELFQNPTGTLKKLTFEVNDTIQPGGCLIETRHGDVDARVDRQLEIIGDELRKAAQGD
jgi:flagellar biosynthesis/type III secretory pathway protein FliH